MRRYPEYQQNLLDWLCFTPISKWRKSRLAGSFVAFLYSLMLGLAVLAAYVILGSAVMSPGSVSLGTGGLIVALLGSPFLIWSTILKDKSVKFQKEGHMTDRLSKAVEQLGAEKTVDRIGRSITIWTGKPVATHVNPDGIEQYKTKNRTTISEVEEITTFNIKSNKVVNQKMYKVLTWPRERSFIQWLDQDFAIEAHEVVGIEGEWKVYTETAPNIEVRVGAVLSLERISQDSTLHDQGRDHVRVMEILSTYVRENAPANEAKVIDFPNQSKDLHAEKKAAMSEPDWLYSVQPPRSDIQTALSVIGRRAEAQISIENGHKDALGHEYRIDLSNSCLRGANLEKSNFSNAILFRCLMQGAYCSNSDFSRANLQGAQMTGAHAHDANFQGADLQLADLSFANLNQANLENCVFSYTHIIKSSMISTVVEFPVNVKLREINRAFISKEYAEKASIDGDVNGVVFVHN